MKKRAEWKKYLIIIFGAILFAGSVNIFIVPCNLYNGGIVGLAQIIRTVLVTFLKLDIKFDIAGIINLMFNIPLAILAYKSLSKKFLYGTVLSIIVQTIAFTIIPVPQTPIITDTLAACTIGGIISAIGVGLTLTTATSCGGTDIIGMYAAINWKNFSVGKMQLAFNIIIYSFCAIFFDLQTAIYSVIYSAIFSYVVDKIHLQNIEMSIMIFTKNKDIKKIINKDFVRGVTYWQGMGAYTDSETEVLVTVVSKYEVNQLKHRIHLEDPKAFIIVNDNIDVLGGFEKRLLD